MYVCMYTIKSSSVIEKWLDVTMKVWLVTEPHSFSEANVVIIYCILSFDKFNVF